MKRSMYVLLGAMGLFVLLSGCQQAYKTGDGSSSSGASAAAVGGSSGPAPGSLQACLDSIGDVTPGQRLLAETTCKRNAKVQEPMDKNPGDYLPPPK